MLKDVTLGRRVLRSTKVAGSAPEGSDAGRSSRPKTYKSWDYEHMGLAVSACVNEGMTIREAACHFGIPKSTLGDRITGRVALGAKSGPKPYLTTEEEDELMQFLLRCASIGYPKSRKDVLALVHRHLENQGRVAHVTNGWWERFCHRHPNLTLRTSAPLSRARAEASDPDMVDRYFDLLKKVMVEYDLIGKPAQIFNVDESGMPLDPKPVKGVFSVGDKNPLGVGSGDKTQLTVVACISASGSCIPPMIVLDRKTLPPYFVVGEVPSTIYGLSPRGWIDQELFDGWFTNHFLRYAPLVRPLLLLLDGHSSHYCPDTIRLAAKEKVIIFALPPNTTHFSQPLDKGCFGPLKSHWKEECHKFMVKNRGKVVSRYSFSTVFCSAWMKAMTIKNIVGGFKVCGIYPLDRDAIKVPRIKRIEKLSEESGLPFIPMLSPARHEKGSTCDFSAEEVKKFKRRYENNYDLQGDHRYNAWLKKYHPKSLTMSNGKEDAIVSFLKPNTAGSVSPDLPSDCHSFSSESSFHSPRPSRRRSSSCPRARVRRDSSSSSSSAATSKSHRVQMLSARSGSFGSLLSTPSPVQRREAPVKSFGRVLTSLENLKLVEAKEKEKLEKLRQKEERKKRLEEKRMQAAEKKKSQAKKLSAKANAKSTTSHTGKRKTPAGTSTKSKGKAATTKCAGQERNDKQVNPDFTEEEVKKFKRRYENNYDLQGDHRYNAWLKKYHPKSLTMSDGKEDATVSFLKPNTAGSVSPDLPSDCHSFSSESSFHSPRPSRRRSSSCPRARVRRDSSPFLSPVDSSPVRTKRSHMQDQASASCKETLNDEQDTWCSPFLKRPSRKKVSVNKNILAKICREQAVGKSSQISSSLSSVVSKQWNLRSAKTSGLGDTSSTVEKKKCCDAIGRPSAHTSLPPRPTKRVNEKSLKDAPAGESSPVSLVVSKRWNLRSAKSRAVAAGSKKLAKMSTE